MNQKYQKGKKVLSAVAAKHDENNLRSAREILANPEAYPPDGGMADWARAMIAKHGEVVDESV